MCVALRLSQVQGLGPNQLHPWHKAMGVEKGGGITGRLAPFRYHTTAEGREPTRALR